MEANFDIKEGMMRLSNSRLVLVAVYGMLLSYFYNLPALSYSARGNNELRIYDIAGLLVMWLYYKNFGLINTIIRRRRTLNSLLLFLFWASITVNVTMAISIIDEKIFWGLQSFLYLFHFWVFYIVTIFVIIIMQDLKQLTRLVNFILVASSITFVIVILQNFGLIPFLWNDSYLRNYDGFLSGTLGPNKIVLGMTCLMIFAFGIGLLNDPRVKINKLLLITTILLSILVLIMSGSRTSYVGLLVFLGYFSIKETTSFFYSGILLAAMTVGLFVLNPEVINKAVDVYEQRVEKKIDNPKEVEELQVDEMYEDLGSGRKQLSLLYINYLIDNPYIIPFGLGFNNRLALISSAHNAYLSLINEVGIVGTFLYFRWLFSYLRIKMPHFSKMRMALKGLALAMIVTLFFGEHLYIYRPLFGLLGLYLFITTLLMSPMYILSHDDNT
ncbi:MAG TPA: O-antigen ligase family protein [Flavobacterium sp.]|jgi:hypothetical protein